MKRIIAFLLALTSVLMFAACGAQQSTPAATQAPTGTETAAAETEAPAANIVTVNGLTYDEDAFKAEPAANRKITVSYGGGSLCTSPAAVAYYLGFYEEEGLNVEIISVESEKEAVASGKLDAVSGFLSSWLPAVSNGVGITFTTGVHTGCASVLVLTDSELNSYSDKVGGTIAISGGFGGGPHNYGMRSVLHEGFGVDEFNWIAFDASLGLEVLKKGDADFLLVPDQMGRKWLDAGEVRRIHSNTYDEPFAKEPCCVFGMSNDFIEENPITAEKMTRAVYRTCRYINQSDEHKQEVVQILADHFNFNINPEYAISLMNEWEFGVSNEACLLCLDNSVGEYVEAGILSADLDQEAFKQEVWKTYDLSDIAAEYPAA